MAFGLQTVAALESDTDDGGQEDRNQEGGQQIEAVHYGPTPVKRKDYNHRNQTYLERECALGLFQQKKWQLQQARLFYKKA